MGGERMKKLFIGVIIGAMLATTITAFAETAQTIDVIFGRVKLIVDGKPVDKETLLYDGATYVPLRAAAEILGIEVGWDGETNTATLTSPVKADPEEEATESTEETDPEPTATPPTGPNNEIAISKLKKEIEEQEKAVEKYSKELADTQREHDTAINNLLWLVDDGGDRAESLQQQIRMMESQLNVLEQRLNEAEHKLEILNKQLKDLE